jgi:hypothetical protein
MPFCLPWWWDDQPDGEIDWTSEDLVESTLRREHLLFNLQELQDSTSAQSAEAALQAMDDAVTEDDDLYLKFLNQAGYLSIVQEVLAREQSRPSPLVAAPLLYKFAKHDIGYQRTESGQIVECERKE